MIDLLTVDDVARVTGFSAYTVRAAIRDGDLQASKMRGRYRIHPDQVAAWIDNSTVRPGEREDTARRSRGTIRRPASKAPANMSAREALRSIGSDAA